MQIILHYNYDFIIFMLTWPKAYKVSAT